MKKILYSAFAALFATCVLTSCGSDGGSESGSNTPQTPTDTSVKATFTFASATNQAFDNIATVSVNYTITDANGSKTTRVVSIPTTLSLSDIACPCTLECTYSYVLMPDKVSQSSEYNLAFGPTLSVTTTNSKSSNVGQTYSPKGVQGSKLVDIFTQLNKNTNKMVATVDKDGVISGSCTSFTIDTTWESLLNGGSNSGQTNPTADTKEQNF